jgi:hypothetical protein
VEDDIEQAPPSVRAKDNPFAQDSIKRARNVIIDSAASICVLLSIAAIFQHLDDHKILLAKLKVAQTHFHDAVTSFDPVSLLELVVYSAAWIIAYVEYGLSHAIALIFSQASGDAFVSAISGIIQSLSFMSAVVLLPLLIVIQIVAGAHLLEGILALGSWLIFAPLIVRNATKDSLGRTGISPYLNVGLVVVIFLWCVKGVMVVADLLFGRFIDLAELAVTPPVMGTALYWGFMKVTEHSLTETALHSVKRLLSRVLGR